MSNVILLVEDNPTDEKLTLRAFTKCRVMNEVVVAHDGREALDYLLGSEGNESRELPCLVLLDLKLPKVDGLEVLRRTRSNERTKLLPVVILTASKEDEDVARSYSLGANAYVRKPVDFNQFIDAVNTLGIFWLLLNQPPPPAAPQ